MGRSLLFINITNVNFGVVQINKRCLGTVRVYFGHIQAPISVLPPFVPHFCGLNIYKFKLIIGRAVIKFKNGNRKIQKANSSLLADLSDTTFPMLKSGKNTTS